MKLAFAALALLAACQDSAPAPSPQAASLTPITIDVYADIVCPWCFIGTERLEKVLAASPHRDRVVVRHRPFLLDPDTPAEGANVADMLRRKYGRDPAPMFATVEANARTSGLDLDLSKQPNTYPTLLVHALLLRAEAKGTQRPLKQALFRAYFNDGRNVADRDALTAIATQHGFTSDEVTAVLSDANAEAEVRRASEQARRNGVSGVPLFVFSNGERLSGAQSEANLVAALNRAAAVR